MNVVDGNAVGASLLLTEDDLGQQQKQPQVDADSASNVTEDGAAASLGVASVVGLNASLSMLSDSYDQLSRSHSDLVLENQSLQEKVKELDANFIRSQADRNAAENRSIALSSNNAVQADEIYSLRLTMESLKRELEFVENDKKSLEKQTITLENAVELTASNSSSGLNCLCLTRDRISHLAKELTDLRLFLQDKSPSSGESKTASTPPEVKNGGILQNVMEDLNESFARFEDSLGELVSDIRSSKVAQRHADDMRTQQAVETAISSGDNKKISLTDFKEGDIAIFYPTPRSDYLAFNVNAPHHYLSEESKLLIGI